MEKIELEPRIKDFIQQHKLVLPEETLVLAVSGGADSVCMLHLLARCQKELEVKLHVAHLNHQLRDAESEADARYVAELASSLGIPATIVRRDVATYRTIRSCSIEEAARELRYDFLARVAANVGANRVAIGHTRDDQVETILMHILRGTGTSGLRGLEPYSPMAGMSLQALRFPCHYERSEAISWRSGQAPRSNLLVIRPLLDITREETLNYCREHQLEPRIDSSNLSLSFLRNRLRLELLPLLRKYNSSVDETLLRLAEIARDDSAFIEQQALGLWDEVSRQENGAVYVSKGKIGALPVALQRQLLRLAVAKILGDTRDIEANHIEAVRNLLGKPVGKRISLPHSLVCWSGYDEVGIMRLSSSPQLPFLSCPFPPFSVILSEAKNLIPLKVPGETTCLPGWKVIASIVPEHRDRSNYEPFASPVIANVAKQSQQRGGSNLIADFDLHQTGTELFVRRRQSGDCFQPLGMNMPKRLQEFMVDAKIPLSWRDSIPIVCSPRQIIWVVGWRIDDRVKVSEATKEILRLEFIKLL